jgi:hypothetical protein
VKNNLTNSAVPFVNCVQIKYPNPRRMNEKKLNAENKKVNKKDEQMKQE